MAGFGAAPLAQERLPYCWQDGGSRPEAASPSLRSQVAQWSRIGQAQLRPTDLAD